MKLLKGLTALAAACATLVCAAGCNKKTYYVYTNIPQGQYEICDKQFKLGGEIAGYSAAEGTFAEEDTSGFTSRRRTYFEMMADANLVISANFEREGELEKYTAFYKAVGAQLNAVDKALSATVTGSDVYNFNAADAGEIIGISKITYEVLSIAKSVHTLTDGAYNPALYYNIYAYGFGDGHDYPESKADLPADETIEKYTALAAHFNEVELSESEGKYFVQKPSYTVEVEGETLSMKLDLGGIGKGYAVDLVDALFEEYGYNYGYFNFGSSSMLVKSNVKSGAYKIGFAGPRSPSRDPYLETSLRGEKLSTSGDNEQFYNLDGTRYCHIIDPATGKPVQTGIMSVTVIGGSAAEDDALTTAIMAMGRERAIAFIEEKLTDRKVTFTCG